MFNKKARDAKMVNENLYPQSAASFRQGPVAVLAMSKHFAGGSDPLGPC